MKTVILANGKFPEHPTPLKYLRDADVVVCCDGSTDKLILFGLEPTAIVGDLDSLTEDLKIKFANKLFHNPDQNTNDLTKAVNWCISRSFKHIRILGATGLREDHTIGNIGLLNSYAENGIFVEMITDFGTLTPILSSTKFNSYAGQTVSIFSQNNQTKISTVNLEYPIKNEQLTQLWMGTLNRCMGNWFEVKFDVGQVIVFRSH